MVRFIHAADLHLDSPLRGLERYEGAPVEQIRLATRRAFQRLVEFAIDQRVELLLIAGDVYDGNWRDHNTGLFFTRELQRLRDAGIIVVMIRGNHDAENKMTRSLRLPDGVTLFGSDQPETLDLDDLGIAVHGQSFAQAAVTENLAERYPPARRGSFNIGLLHTALTGAEGHDPYAPCTPAQLQQHGYDYWALGHIHQRNDEQYRDPAIVYPGNLQGRHARECGPKGAMLGTIENGRLTGLEFHPLDVMRWEQVMLDLTQARVVDDVYERFDHAVREQLQRHDGLPLALRVNLQGETRLHSQLAGDWEQVVQEVRSTAIQISAERVWVEKVKLLTSDESRGESLALHEGPLEELRQLFQGVAVDDARWEEWVSPLRQLRRKLPAGQAAALDQILQCPTGQRSEWVREIDGIVCGRLQSPGGSS